jgi:hypothetical protein
MDHKAYNCKTGSSVIILKVINDAVITGNV